MTTQAKQDVSIKIKEMNFTKNSELVSMLETKQEFKGDDLCALWQTLHTMDKIIAKKNEKNLEFSGDSIKLELSDTDGKKIDIDAKLGEGYFSKGLDHLLNLGSKDISINQPNDETKEFFAKILEKANTTDLEKANTTEIENIGTNKQPSHSKNPSSSASINNVINGGTQALQTTAALIDETLGDFVKNMCEKFQSISGTSKNNQSLDQQMQEINNANTKKVIQDIKEGKVKISSKKQEKERSNNKDRSIGL